MTPPRARPAPSSDDMPAPTEEELRDEANPHPPADGKPAPTLEPGPDDAAAELYRGAYEAGYDQALVDVRRTAAEKYLFDAWLRSRVDWIVEAVTERTAKHRAAAAGAVASEPGA